MKLTINNSFSQVSDYTPEQFKALRNLLSYSETKATRFGGYSSTQKYLIDRRGCFPTGLLTRLLKWVDKTGTEVDSKDLRIRPRMPQVQLFHLSLPYDARPEQIEIAEACTHRGTVSAVTGFGKSVAMALVVQSLQLKTLIIVPNIGLKQQLTNDFKSYFKDLTNITIENIDSTALQSRKDYDVLIIDEAHHAASDTYRKLNAKVWNKIYYRFFFTGTPFRTNSEENILLESIAGDLIYKIDYHKAVQKGYITPIQCFYYELPIIKPKGNPKSYQAMVSELIIERQDKNDLIAQLVCDLEEAGESTLVLLKEIKHGEIIQDLILKKGKEVAFAHGKNTDNRMLLLEFNLKERATLIGTSVLGEGIDTRPASYVLLAAGGKSKVQLLQNIGRLLRKSPGKSVGTVILFYERSCPWFVAHFAAVKKAIKQEYGIELIKI